MHHMYHIFYLVFSQLAIGGFALLLLVPKGLVGRNFYRLMGAIYLLVMVLARCAHLPISGHAVTLKNFLFAWRGQDSFLTLLFTLLLFGYMISLWLRPDALSRVLLIAGTIFGLVGVVYSSQFYASRIDLSIIKYLLPLQFLASTATLGAVNSGMWFGHWYLVTPNLPVTYLRRFNWIFLCSLSFTILFFLLSIFLRSGTAQIIPSNFFDQVVFGIRLMVGFGGSLLMVIIIWYCLRKPAVERDAVGATRAATGFLYIAMVTVFMSEFCGRQLLWFGIVL